jgi:hypothetical protein
MIPHHDGAIVMCNIVRAAVSGNYSGMDMRGGHMMPDGTWMANSAGMAGMHIMPDGTLMNNTAMAGQHVMPNGEIMNNEDMEPMDPQPMDPFIEELCNAIEAGQTDEINAMIGWLADRGLEPEAPCAHSGESCDSCCPSPPECRHDTDGDGLIGVDDLLSLLAQYGRIC